MLESSRAASVSKGLTVVVPAKDKRDSIAPLVHRIVGALPQGGETIFVDDSDDATPEQIRALAQTARVAGWTVLLAHRLPGQRDGGLGGAVVEGVRAMRRQAIDVDTLRPLHAHEWPPDARLPDGVEILT